MLHTVFPLGRIVSSQDVVDRKPFIEGTKLRLLQGNSVMLSGPRRIGKSSVAYEILRQLQRSDCYIAKVDLFHVTSIEEFATKLLQSVLENRTGILGQMTYALKQWKAMFQVGEVHAKIQDLELGLKLEAQTTPSDLLEIAIQTADKLATKDGKRMIVLFDEFQELERLGGEPLLKKLRSMFQQQENTVYFFLGSESSLLNTIFADRRQAFYRFATFLQLPLVPENEWRLYIEDKLSKENMRITESAIKLLLERTGGQPYCVMSVMSNAYSNAKMSDLREMNAETLHLAYEQSISQLGIIYEEQWQEIRRFKGADIVLTSILLGNPLYQKENHVKNVNRAIQNLIRLSVIKKGENRGRYILLEPMFGDWIVRKKQGR